MTAAAFFGLFSANHRRLPARTRHCKACPRAGWLPPRTSTLHQTEPGVHVGIIRAEPVAEARTREDRRGSWGRPFQDVMLAIEEVGRITRVKRMRGKTVERREDVARPLPSVAGHLRRRVDAGIAGVHRRWAPIPIIEVVAPRIRCGPAGRAVKLRFGH